MHQQHCISTSAASSISSTSILAASVKCTGRDICPVQTNEWRGEYHSRRSWVAGIWLLVCCVLGATGWVLLRVLLRLPFKKWGPWCLGAVAGRTCALPSAGGGELLDKNPPCTCTERRSVPQSRTRGWQMILVDHLALHHMHKPQHMHTGTTFARLENQSVEVSHTHPSTLAPSNTHTAH